MIMHPYLNITLLQTEELLIVRHAGWTYSLLSSSIIKLGEEEPLSLKKMHI